MSRSTLNVHILKISWQSKLTHQQNGETWILLTVVLKCVYCYKQPTHVQWATFITTECPPTAAVISYCHFIHTKRQHNVSYIHKKICASGGRNMFSHAIFNYGLMLTPVPALTSWKISCKTWKHLYIRIGHAKETIKCVWTIQREYWSERAHPGRQEWAERSPQPVISALFSQLNLEQWKQMCIGGSSHLY